jgi:hypothetical protein
MNTRSLRSRSGWALLAATLSVMAGLYLVRYYYFVHHLVQFDVLTLPSYKQPIFPKLSERQAINLGWAHTEEQHPKTSYVTASQTKGPGKVRIGIFGDSFVEGIETEAGFDFPSLLQRKFRESDSRNVEVFNFGVRSYGVHQSHLLWDYLGRNYDLDYVVMMPFAWHDERDSSFLYAYNSLGPVHARYILENGRLRFVPVIGQTRADADRVYNRLLTPWQYVHYDDKAPIFLRALMPIDRKFTINPFYYRLFDKREEIFRTYELLLRNLATQARNVIIICNDQDICRLETSVKGDNVYFLRSWVSKYTKHAPSLYAAPLGHLSALGNQLRANELYFLLVGERNAPCDVIELSPDETVKALSSGPGPLYEAQGVSANIASQSVASFVMHAGNAPAWNFSEDVDFRRQKIAALLWTKINRDIAFIPTGFLLSQNVEQIFLSLGTAGDRMLIPIGNVHASGGVIGKLEITGSDETEHSFVSKLGKKVSWSGDYFHAITVWADAQIDDVAIVLGDESRAILKGTAEALPKRIARSVLRSQQRFFFEPAMGKYIHLRAKNGQSADINKIEPSGTLDLIVADNEHAVGRYAIVSYRKSTGLCGPADRPYSKIITRPPRN